MQGAGTSSGRCVYVLYIFTWNADLRSLASRPISNASRSANLASTTRSVRFIGRMKTLPQMSAVQLAVLLRAVHAYNDQYTANGNSCYWYVFGVMEIIRTKFAAVPMECSALSERSIFAR